MRASWRQLNTRGASAGSTARHAHVVWVVNGKIYLHGGQNAQKVSLDDCLMLDPATLQWRAVNCGETQIPSPRSYHTATVYNESRVIVFGGALRSGEQGATEFLNDCWLFRIADSSWDQCLVAGKPPKPRAAHTAVLVAARTQLAVFGGCDGNVAYNDLWLMPIASPRWELVSSKGTVPSKRCYHTASIHGACSIDLRTPSRRALVRF